MQPEFINQIKDTQRDILSRYSNIAKVGGKVVYVTCSILPSENEEQVALFLGLNPNFKPIKDKKYWPANLVTMGFTWLF